MACFLRTLAHGLAIALIAATVVAHVRLTNPGNGNYLHWTIPDDVGIVVSSIGSDDVLDAADEVAIRLAIQDWNEVTGSDVTLVEDLDPATRARTDWSSNAIHLVFFDETNASGYFSGGGTVAVTPIWFYSNGRISDADILFNGSGFGFTASGANGRFDIQDVAAHELGHLVGLDHSGWAGATMYPYVDPRVIEHRSLSEDEVHGLRHISASQSFGKITGTIRRESDDSVVRGAHVVARDETGRTRAGILTEDDGHFTLPGLEPATYTVYVVPLDEPVSAANLGGGLTIQVDFEPAFYSSSAVITGTNTVALGTLDVADDVLLNLGRNSDRYPIRIQDGTSTSITIRGTGLFTGASLEASDPDLVVGSPTWYGSQVVFPLTIPDGEPLGHIDLMVTNASGDISVLPAALEVTPPSPTVTDVTPDSGSVTGGEALTITGTEFHPGARVVIGDRIYTDGAVGGATVVSPTTITLTTGTMVAGLHDVVVIDASGVEGRAMDAYTAADVPVVDTVFPPAGSFAGGTTVAVTGAAFQAGATVRIDGVTQSTIVRESETMLTFESVGGAPGGPYLLEVENPDLGVATSAFAYETVPDPQITTVEPAVGSKGGGDTVTITGANFSPDMAVSFGDDPDTGAGGVEAAEFTYVDETTIEVVTPAHAAGEACVMVSNSSTDQAVVLAGGFTFQGGGGSGGGGCSTRDVNLPPMGPREALLSSAWALLLLTVLVVRAHRARLALERF